MMGLIVICSYTIMLILLALVLKWVLCIFDLLECLQNAIIQMNNKIDRMKFELRIMEGVNNYEE